MTLATEWPQEPVEATDKRAGYTILLEARRFDIENPPPKPPPVFRLGDAVIATPGNLVGLQAQVKAGKSAVVGALIAATMEPDGDCLSFSSANPKGGAVIHFDTEQSPADHHTAVMRALWRAKKKAPPPWLRSYRLADVPTQERRAALLFELERAEQECGSIHSVTIDGVADLCIDPNDPAEAFALVDELHQQAIKYNAPIVCVLHENPGSENGKTRGHLGSQLERKAETNLRLVKDREGVTVVFSERARNANIPKESGPRFMWSDEEQMHVSTETRAATKADEKREELREEAVAAFEGVPEGLGLSYSSLLAAIESTTGVKTEGARTVFKNMKKHGVIAKGARDKWTLSKW